MRPLSANWSKGCCPPMMTSIICIGFLYITKHNSKCWCGSPLWVWTWITEGWFFSALINIFEGSVAVCISGSDATGSYPWQCFLGTDTEAMKSATPCPHAWPGSNWRWCDDITVITGGGLTEKAEVLSSVSTPSPHTAWLWTDDQGIVIGDNNIFPHFVRRKAISHSVACTRVPSRGIRVGIVVARKAPCCHSSISNWHQLPSRALGYKPWVADGLPPFLLEKKGKNPLVTKWLGSLPIKCPQGEPLESMPPRHASQGPVLPTPLRYTSDWYFVSEIPSTGVKNIPFLLAFQRWMKPFFCLACIYWLFLITDSFKLNFKLINCPEHFWYWKVGY